MTWLAVIVVLALVVYRAGGAWARREIALAQRVTRPPHD